MMSRGTQFLLFGGSEPVEASGEIMGTGKRRGKIVLSKVVHARVTNSTYRKLRSVAHKDGVTVSKLLARILAEV